MIASEFAKNLDVVAVVGHIDSNVAIPVSITYEFNGLVFITPAATNPRLTQHDFKYVFRNVPNDDIYGKELAYLAFRKKYMRVIIVNVSDAYGTKLSNIFKIFAEENGIEIVGQIAINTWEKEIKNVIINQYFKQTKPDFDAVFVAAVIPMGAKIIKTIYELIGVNVPIIGGDGLDSNDLWRLAKKSAEGTIVPSDIDIRSDEFKKFSSEYFARFKINPDTWAAKGYDAIKLLAFAMEKSGATSPYKVAETLRYVRDWKGVTGIHKFNKNGDVVEKDIYFKELRNGKFEYIETKS